MKDVDVKAFYDYEHNRFSYVRNNGIIYNLQLRGNITIIDSGSGTGRTPFVDEIAVLQSNPLLAVGADIGNVVIMRSKDEPVRDRSVLYIVDRAQTILNDSLCEKIRDCRKAHFLIIKDGEYSFDLAVSPNHFGTFETQKNEITIYYEFNVPAWC